MAAKVWITWILFSGLLWNAFISKANNNHGNCLKSRWIFLVNSSLQSFSWNNTQNDFWKTRKNVFLDNTAASINRSRSCGISLAQSGSSHLLFMQTLHNTNFYVVHGYSCWLYPEYRIRGNEWCEDSPPNTFKNCRAASNCSINGHRQCNFRCFNTKSINITCQQGRCQEMGKCNVSCFNTKTICGHIKYNETYCKEMGNNNSYIINITATNQTCYNCIDPVIRPNIKIIIDNVPKTEPGQTLDAAEASKIQKQMDYVAANLDKSSAFLSAGEGIHGAIVKNSEEPKDIYFAYTSPTDKFDIFRDRDSMATFSRSIGVPKEAFEKAASTNVSVPFAAVLLFTNLAQDEKNSTVLRNEVLMVEMGTRIANLTNSITIDFQNISDRGIPSCQSWDGEGLRPNWTDEGCKTETVDNGTKITCHCSHLTFFAILMTPPNVTISSSDLSSLNTITQIGCGLSIFFLSIVIFMHFLLRKGSATDTMKLLIHLVVAMLLLNLTFLINNPVAKLKSSVGCKIMAALMHYFLLATFTWFAVQALHLCLQMYKRGNIVIHHYMLKVCITSWFTPSVIVVVLFILGKYGEQVIHTDNAANNVSMCWIIDEAVHYIVNIGYYVLVFLLTFTTFITMLSWLCYFKKTKDKQADRNGISIMTIMGLCCMLGITWGFAFFAYGDLRIPSYYIFTILNSLQGFFLFIYYYKRGKNVANTSTPTDSTTNASKTTTIGTDLLDYQNPYSNVPKGKH